MFARNINVSNGGCVASPPSLPCVMLQSPHARRTRIALAVHARIDLGGVRHLEAVVAVCAEEVEARVGAGREGKPCRAWKLRKSVDGNLAVAEPKYGQARVIEGVVQLTTRAVVEVGKRHAGLVESGKAALDGEERRFREPTLAGRLHERRVVGGKGELEVRGECLDFTFVVHPGIGACEVSTAAAAMTLCFSSRTRWARRRLEAGASSALGSSYTWRLL